MMKQPENDMIGHGGDSGTIKYNPHHHVGDLLETWTLDST